MASAAEAAALPSPAAPSSGQSPVPYLFCGLAAMLGLIAFALLILGCSYWKLYVSRDNGERRDDVEADGGAKAAPPVFEEKYLVIMAGQQKPSFLATPTSNTSRASSFGSKSSFRSGSSETSLAIEKMFEEKMIERGRQIEMGNNESALDQFQ